MNAHTFIQVLETPVVHRGWVALMIASLLTLEVGAEDVVRGERVTAAPPITALAFAPGGQVLVVGSQAGIELRHWPTLTVERRLESELTHVHDLAFSPDGRWLVAGGGDPADSGLVELRSWPAARVTYARHAYGDLVYAVAWSPDAQRFACGSYDRTVGVHEGPTGKLLHRLKGHSRAVLAVSFARDSETLVSAGVDLSVRVWNPSEEKARRVLDHHTGPVFDLAARPSSEGSGLPMVASVSDDRTLRLWQPTIGRLVRFARLPARPLAVDWTAKGERVVAACDDGHLRVVDPDRVQIERDVPAFEGWAYSVAVHCSTGDVAIGGERGQLVRVALEDAE